MHGSIDRVSCRVTTLCIHGFSSEVDQNGVHMISSSRGVRTLEVESARTGFSSGKLTRKLTGPNDLGLGGKRSLDQASRQHAQWAELKGLFSLKKKIQDSLSYRILWHMYEALNIDENKKLITQFICKSRDESFELS